MVDAVHVDIELAPFCYDWRGCLLRHALRRDTATLHADEKVSLDAYMKSINTIRSPRIRGDDCVSYVDVDIARAGMGAANAEGLLTHRRNVGALRLDAGLSIVSVESMDPLGAFTFRLDGDVAHVRCRYRPYCCGRPECLLRPCPLL